jgi:hypothetical protein
LSGISTDVIRRDGTVLSLLRELLSIFDSIETARDIMISWRLVLCLVVALGAVLLGRHLGRPWGEGAFVMAALAGLTVGLAWELLAAARRRGYI